MNKRSKGLLFAHKCASGSSQSLIDFVQGEADHVPHSKKWISIEELAEHLDVSAVTIRFWIRSGKDIPAVRIGRQWRFKIEDVDEWIQSGRSNFSG